MKIPVRSPIILYSLILVTVQGCQQLPPLTDQVQSVSQSIAESGLEAAAMASEFVTPHSYQIHQVGWTYGNNTSPPMPQLYCYQTLGNINCFTHPRPGHGWYQQRPAPDVTMF